MTGNYGTRYGKRAYTNDGAKKGRKGHRQLRKANKARVRRHLDSILREEN